MPTMRTRAQERAPSAEPGATAPSSSARPNRKRRASSTVPASDSQFQDSQNASQQQVIKKRKKTTVVTTTTSHDIESHPHLSTLDEEQVLAGTNGANPDEDHAVVSAIHSDNRRSTLPAHMSTNNVGSSKSRTSSRKSLPALLTISDHDEEHLDVAPDPFDPLTMQLIQQHREKREQQNQSLVQLDGSDDLPAELEDADVLVDDDLESSFSTPMQLHDHQSLKALLTHGEISATDSVTGAKTDLQRHTYEAHIDRITLERAEAKAALEVLASGLESMGFGDPDSTSHQVLESILGAFGQSRSALRLRFPLETANDIPESTMLANITDLLNSRDRQVDSLLDKLDAIAIRFHQLREDKAELQRGTAEDSKYIEDLELRLADVEQIQTRFSLFTSESSIQIAGLQDKNASLKEKLDAANLALEESGLSVVNLQAAIERVEIEHAKDVGGLESDRDNALARLASADEEIIAKTQDIKILKETCEKYTGIIADYSTQIKHLSASLEEEIAAREAAEADASKKLEIIRQQEEDLAELERHNESEKRQRESAETELDERQTEVQHLTDKLHKQGIEANQLRQKMYEQQLHSQKLVEELEATIKERDQLLTDEKQEHADTEAQAADRIAELENQLSLEVEESKKKSLAYGRALDDLEQRNLDLEAALIKANSALAQKTAELAESEELSSTKIAELDSTIRDFEDALAQEKDKLAATQDKALLQQQQMNSSLSERDADIKQLSTNLNNAQKIIADLEGVKDSLERRVESQAEAMLVYQSDKSDEIDALQELIRAKQGEIEGLGEKAVMVDRKWQELDQEKETIILQRNEDVLALKTRNAELRALVLSYMARAKADAAAVFDSVEKLAVLDSEDGDVLGESPVVIATERKKVRKSRKSVRDSGVAIASDGAF